MKWAEKQRGFTIVELLIVIVVIAILAAITIVAYNGIAMRAKASAAQTAAESASKKVLTYMTTNGEQLPPDLATAGVMDSSNTTFQYSVNTSVTPQTFCVTATTSNVSYYIDNSTHNSPTVGACPGHGLNGVAPITNIILNPSVEASTTSWSNNNAGGTATASRQTSSPANGSGYFRVTWTANATILGGGCYSYITSGDPFAVTTGQTYTFSMYVRPSRTQKVSLQVEWRDSSGTMIGSVTFGSSTQINAGTWTRLSLSSAAPAGAARLVLATYAGAGGTMWASGDYLDCDASMMTAGSTLYNYADGNSSNWVWNGAVNASPSTGPPL